MTTDSISLEVHININWEVVLYSGKYINFGAYDLYILGQEYVLDDGYDRYILTASEFLELMRLAQADE